MEEISSHITENMTLSSDVLYVVTDNIDVNATLTIEAGTEIEFEQQTRLRVTSDGAIIADGTEDEPILFTATQQTPGWWQGIHIRRSTDMNNLMDHVTIEYAGDGDRNANLTLGGTISSDVGQLTLTNSILRDSDAAGLWVSDDSTVNDDVCDDNSFEDNADDGCVVEE